MLKEKYHPRAFLTLKRNIRPGLVVRTLIILKLEAGATRAKTLAENIKSSYRAVLYHLHLLQTERIIIRKGKRPQIWELTGIGQQRLTNQSN